MAFHWNCKSGTETDGHGDSSSAATKQKVVVESHWKNQQYFIRTKKMDASIIYRMHDVKYAHSIPSAHLGVFECNLNRIDVGDQR